MKPKKITIMLILVLILFTGCNSTNILNAEFTNVTPAKIEMNGSTYLLTDEILSTNEVDKQIGKITQVHAIVSYLEDENPYKNPSKIYEVKNMKTEEAIAVEVNNKLYISKTNK